MNLELVGFNNSFPRDVDVLLVGPTGKKRIVMSDVGGAQPVAHFALGIDDQAASRFSADDLSNGSFKPTNLEVGDPFPSPAPAAGRRSRLSGFDGTNPNGTWKLFVVDDAGSDSGSIVGGWAMQITAR